MNNPVNKSQYPDHNKGCSCCSRKHELISGGVSRRKFLQVTGASTLGALTLPGLSWSALASVKTSEQFEIRRTPLVVKPILTYEVATRREQTTWRQWGGIQTQKDADQEVLRIKSELKDLQSGADFPVEFLPVSLVRTPADLSSGPEIQSADLFLVYAAGGSSDIFDSLYKTGKDIIFFCRHKSGPVYLWYEIISPRYLRQHSDNPGVPGIDFNDVVIDSQDEILWRLRALCGLKNTLYSRIVALGGAGGWGGHSSVAPIMARKKYKLEIMDFSYKDLGELITEARADKSVISRAKSRADDYLTDPAITLETRREFVDNCFVLEDVLIRLMEKFNCRAFTIRNCMDTIMPTSETAACLTLGLLNDAGYLAFCESDFVVVPAGILMANITGKPVFFCNPTYPHNGIKTLSHCTAPRRMDGKKLEPARLLTHFESDYGAAPKVEMSIGQTVTNIIPDFSSVRNIGLLGKIIENPFIDICRTQINISFECNSLLLAEKMPGFHWITVYGDYIKESGYALKKIGIDLETLV